MQKQEYEECSKRKLGKRSAEHEGHRLRQRPYKCERCGHWHLTTQDRGQRTR